ncbi:LPS-assembly protein LptD, partial [bacterium]|nr:LPS-assembly protein LptD [bacterium]
TTIGDSIAVWFGEAKFDSIEVHNGVDGYYVSRELSSDSLKSVESEDTLYYSGDYLALSRENEIVAVQGEAKISYDDMTLEAGDVQYEIKRNLLIARPQVLEDSTVGMPVLSDNKQTIRGKKIIYNVDTGRGRMVSASSSLDLGYFRGGVVHKAQGETLFVANSEFVPCECETAMTHFWSDRVKLIPKEKAIARHIVLYIGHLPLFAIPFFVFPVQSGRTSGLLTFDIGQFQKGDRFIRNIGYYWAPSDYWDIKASVDYDEGKGLILRSAGQYVLRYKMKGNISTIYEIRRQREFLQSTGSNRWSISGSHLQYLWPRSSITARASFVSDKEYLTDVEFDPQERMQRNLSSSAAFSQDFDWGYLSLGVERNENLETGKITSKIPKIKISRYTRPLFPAENELNSKFYNKLSLALNGYSIYYKESDTLGSLEHFGVQSDPSLSLPFLLGPYLTLNPRVSGRFVTIDEGVDSTAWPMRFTYNAGVDANTNIYGRIPLVGFLGIESLKHDIAPKFGLSWTPEFESGENFYSFAGISAGGGSEAFKANVSITQDLGLLKLADSLGNQRNIRLGTVTTSTSYDFFSEGAKISDIRTSIRTSPASWLSMTAGFTHSVYPEGSDEPSTYRLLSREITTNLSYRGNFSFGDSLSRVRRDFKASISHYISDRLSGGVLSVSHWLKGGLDIYITQNWRLEYSHYYDIEKMEKVSDELRLWRDMGCWEGTFVWVPSGFRKGWYFRINIKKLPDIKVEGSRGKVR